MQFMGRTQDIEQLKQPLYGFDHQCHQSQYKHDRLRDALSRSSDRIDSSVGITMTGLYANMGLAVAKVVGGHMFNSQALIADALHSLTDLMTDLVALAAIFCSLKPASDRFPTGFGKVETLGGLAVSGLLISAGVMIGLQSVKSLSEMFVPGLAPLFFHRKVNGFEHDTMSKPVPDLSVPDINAAWLAAGSILVKEWLYKTTIAVAERKKSSVLAANAHHHRADSLTAFAALLTIATSHYFPTAMWTDPVCGLIISCMVLLPGLKNTRSALLELVDAAVDDDLKESVLRSAKCALQSQYRAGIDLEDVRVAKSGQDLSVDIVVGAPIHWNLGDLDGLRNNVAGHLMTGHVRIRAATVRFVPREAGFF